MFCKKFVQLVLAACIGFTLVNSIVFAEDINGFVGDSLFINGDGGNSSSETDYDFVNFLPGTDMSGCIYVNAGGEVHLYGGKFDSEWGASAEGFFEMSFIGGSVTVHGKQFWVGGKLIPDEFSSVILSDYPMSIFGCPDSVPDHPIAFSGNYNLAWEHHDGTIYNIWIDSLVSINLSKEPAKPEIVVYPAELRHDYGDIKIGESSTYVVTVENIGIEDLTLSPLLLKDNADFLITDAPDYVEGVIVISPKEIVDIEITYMPSVSGAAEATLTIASDDEDEPSVDVVLVGVGVATEVPIEEQVQVTIEFYNQSIEDGLILGYAPRQNARNADNRVKALRNMLMAAGRLIDAGQIDTALKQLEDIAKKTDGEDSPPDFVVGDSVFDLNLMVNDMIAALSL